MRFLHTSDLQIGKAFGRAPEHARGLLQEARLEVIETLAAAARDKSAKFIVVAGDLFDAAAPSDRELANAIGRMSRDAAVRWYLLPGNHDPARGDGLWTRIERLGAGNVILLLEPTPVQVEADVWLLPAPLLHKRTVEDATAWWDDAETAPGVRRIGVGHGSVVDFSKGRDVGENLIVRDRATRARLDYLALGDWHNASSVCPRTYYAGTPEPDDHDRSPTGQAWLVELRAAGELPVVSPIATAAHNWLKQVWSVQHVADVDREIAKLSTTTDLSKLVLRLQLDGVVSLAERAAIEAKLRDDVAHQLRWLDLDLKQLVIQPTDDDLSAIDAGGVLRTAAERLRKMADADGPDAARAMSALARLYLEQVRAPAEVGA